jgi:peptide/nickel transport system permease protein
MNENGKQKEKRFIPPIYWRRLFKQFKIFYNSKYGKVGFLILLVFAVFAMVTPFVVQNPNYYHTAPAVDGHVAEKISSTDITSVTNNSTIYSPMATSVYDEGTSAIYFGTSAGDIYCYGLGGVNSGTVGAYHLIYNSNLTSKVHMQNPVMIPLLNCKILSSPSGVATNQLVGRFIILPYSNGTISIGKIDYFVAGLSKPHFQLLTNFKYNGTMIGNITTNSQPFTNLINDRIPTYNFPASGSLSYKRGQIYFTTQNASGYYLNDYTIFPEKFVKAFKLTERPSGIAFYGSQFTETHYKIYSRILVYNNKSITAFSSHYRNDVWSKALNQSLSTAIGLVIPEQYQITHSTNNSAFVITGLNKLYEINLKSGKISYLVNMSETVLSLTTSPGSSGFPTSILATGHTDAFMIHQNSLGKIKVSKFPLPKVSGEFNSMGLYDPLSNNIIIASSTGMVLSVNPSNISGSPFSWSASAFPIPSKVTALIYFTDANTGTGAVSFITNNGYIYLYASTAKNCNPLPPMVKTVTGSKLLLGTSNSGSDVWSRFMESFYNDWIFGLTIGFFTITISLLVALYVGYKGGTGGRILETLSLALFLVPGLALLIALSSMLPATGDFIDLILIVSLTGWPFAAFTLIGVVRGVSARSFVEASRLFGSKSGAIMRRHIMPNIGPLLIYLLALSIGAGIGAVSGLEFLGLAPLNTATWGGMLNTVYVDYFTVITRPAAVFPPVIALTMFIFSLIFVSRGMDEVSNPRLRRR